MVVLSTSRTFFASEPGNPNAVFIGKASALVNSMIKFACRTTGLANWQAELAHKVRGHHASWTKQDKKIRRSWEVIGADAALWGLGIIPANRGMFGEGEGMGRAETRPTLAIPFYIRTGRRHRLARRVDWPP